MRCCVLVLVGRIAVDSLPHPSLTSGGSSSSTPRERHASVDYPFNLVRLYHKYHPPSSSPEHKTNEEVCLHQHFNLYSTLYVQYYYYFSFSSFT